MGKPPRDLHAEIMNLCCNSLHAGSPSQDIQDAYAKGFKRARHDAAELANDFISERDELKEAKRELLESLKECEEALRFLQDRGGMRVNPPTLEKACAAIAKHTKGE